MKKIMLICAPVSSRSGYGEHARDLVWSFLQHDKYDIRISDVPWGECPRNALVENSEYNKRISECIITTDKNQLTQQPDIYVDIRIPNEFQTHGKFNIGITAGIESSIVSQKWLEGCNKMDLIIVPSEHSKLGFAETIYDKMQNLPNAEPQKIGEVKLEKPIEVLFEGADEDVYKSIHYKEIDSDFFDMLNEKVPEKFAFLSVGMWGKGAYGEDRKDIGKLIKVFYESFANKKKQPALILKTSGATFSVIQKQEVLDKIKGIKQMFPKEWKLPNVYLLHGDLSKEEMNYLYNHPKVKCMVSFTHGEGFGRPLLEATMTGLPVIASGWSGHLDFLDKEKSLLLPGDLVDIPESVVWEDILIKGSKWINIDENICYKSLNEVFTNISTYKKNAEELRLINYKKFTLNKMTEKLDDIMKQHTKKLSTNVKLELPQLKKVEV